MSKINHEEIGEGNLHALSDDDYFDDLNYGRVVIYDADGSPLDGIYDDVRDERSRT